MYPACGSESLIVGGGVRSAPPTVSYAAAALVYERRNASSTKRFTAADQKNPTCPPG